MKQLHPPPTRGEKEEADSTEFDEIRSAGKSEDFVFSFYPVTVDLF